MSIARPLTRPLSTTITRSLDGYWGDEAAQVGPVNTAAPALSGSAIVGGEAALSDGTWTGAVALEKRYLADGVPISGETGDTITWTGAEDQATVFGQVRAQDAGGAWSAWVSSNAAAITYAPAVASGGLGDVTFQRGAGDQLVNAAADFSGAVGGAWSVSGGGASIDAAGEVTIPDDALLSGVVITVSYTNSGGEEQSAFQATVNDVPDAMAAPSVAALSSTSIRVTRGTAPAANNSAITDYTMRWRPTSGGAWTEVNPFGATADIAGLSPSTEYEVQQWATNGVGDGAPSASGLITTDAGGSVGDQTAYFGAATPSGAGGFQPFDDAGQPMPLTGTVTVLSGSPTRTWSINGNGDLVANGTPAVDDGVVLQVTPVSGDPVSVTIDASTYDGEAIATGTELGALIGSTARLSGKDHIFRCRDIATGSISFYEKWQASSLATFRPERTDVRKAILGQIAFNAVSPVGNIEFLDVDFFIAQNAANWVHRDPIGGRIICSLTAGDNIALRRCRVYSDLVPTGEGGWCQEDVRAFDIRASNVTIEDCEIDHVFYGIRAAGADIQLLNLNIHHVYADGIYFGTGADNVLVRGGGEHSKIGFAGVIHSDTFQVQQATAGGVTIEGYIFAPGAYGIARPGMDTWNATVVEATGTAIDPVTHGDKIVQVGAGETYTLPSIASAPQDIEFTFYSPSGTATIQAAGADTHATVSLPKSVTIGQSWSVKSDGTQWVNKPAGTRIGNVKKTTVLPITANDRQHEAIYDTSGGSVVVTLPDAPTDGHWYAVSKWGTDANTVTVQPGAGETMTFDGSLVTEHVIATVLQGKQFIYTGGTWKVVDLWIGNQSFFANAFAMPDDLTIRGCILGVNLTWAYKFQGDGTTLPPNIYMHHNLFYPYYSVTDRNGDGRIGGADGSFIYGTEGTIETNAFTNFICDRNLTNIITVNGGTPPPPMDNDVFGVTLADSLAGDDSKIKAKISGHADNWPTTFAEMRAAAALATGHRTGEYFGPLAFWDFDNNVPLTPEAITIPTPPSTVYEGGPITLTFNHPILFGTGTITLRNVTTDSTIETFDVVADAGTGAGTVSIYGKVLTIDPTTALVAGSDVLSLQFDGTAIDSLYGSSFAAIADDSLSFTAVTPVSPSLTAVIDSRKFGGTTQYESDAGTVDDTKYAVLFIHGRSQLSTIPSLPTLTIGTAGRSVGTGTVLSVTAQKQATNVHTWMVLIAPGDTGGGSMTVQATFGATVFNVDFELYEVDDCSGFGATGTGGFNSGTAQSVAVTTTASYSTVVAGAGVNGGSVTITTADTGLWQRSADVLSSRGSAKVAASPGSSTSSFTLSSGAAAALCAVELLAA